MSDDIDINIGGDLGGGDMSVDTGADFGGDLAGDEGVDLSSYIDGDDNEGDQADGADEDSGSDSEEGNNLNNVKDDVERNDLLIEIQELKSEYFEDLKSRSEYPDSIINNNNDWYKREGNENAEMREEFDEIKKNLISQWEEENNSPWPTYQEDVFTEAGRQIRKIGDRYDAHHIQPLTYGGENTAANITPLHALEHFDKQGIHAHDSPFGRMERL